MSLEQELMQRSSSQCELCTSKDDLNIYAVPNSPAGVEQHILICETCKTQIEDPEKVEPNHWRCLNDSMWSPVPAVQVMAWRMLNRLKSEGWPQDLLDMMYMEEDIKEWAAAGQTAEAGAGAIGSSMVAKRGTAVRKVSLVHDNAEQIEGKVDGQQIVILTKFVKKV